ncbi:lytic murein transglycosylase [Paraglaciecola sp. 25GB23A]|uniref:lytic murein transglycosylase n=1 Tax=Paraglaciecola sp. 25GB23A TaxID=3156068 RepID=UPI0032B004B1
MSIFYITLSSLASAQVSFDDYIQQLKKEAVQQGFKSEFIELQFSDVQFHQKAVVADKNQPESKITLDKYLATRVPDWKVKQALELMEQHKVVLAQVERQYGVQARFVVALWANESNFGRYMGKYPVISSLATMAYEGRREDFFKKQLFAALTIVEQGHVSHDDFLGSWAGAMGQSQFMPTTFLAYAVDFDADGKKDIWANTADVFASIANFLKSEGWNDTLTWGRQVSLPKEFDMTLIGLGKLDRKTLLNWQALGVRRYDGEDLPALDLMASLIAPDGPDGRIYLVYENFNTLMKWNRSSYFGTAIGYLSDRIKKGS